MAASPFPVETDRLARILLGRLDAFIVGSGKSTLAYPLTDALNRLAHAEVATCVGIDGWHYSRARLHAMPDPDHLLARRGAHFTFDAPAYAAFVAALAAPGAEVAFPTFSHADCDPVPNGGRVRAEHRIVIIEGLHALLDVAPWSTAAGAYAERIWVDTPRALARDRLVARHLGAGVEPTWAAALRRVEESDMLNADTLLAHRLAPTIVVAPDGPAPALAPAAASL